MSLEGSWNRVTRRRLVEAGGAAAAGLLLADPFPSRARARVPRFESDPFSLGVASGDPLPDGVVLWTRLAPDPFAPDGGLPPVDVPVRWELARDEGFRRVVRRGTATASPRLAHSVHVEVDGLEPRRPYWYRFSVGAARSPVGRTLTAPEPEARVRELALALCSCSRYEVGYFTAYRHLADEDLDLVVHVGDYLYEYAIAPDGAGVRAAEVPDVARAEARDLDTYRLRHALHKTDPDLQAAHAAHPWATLLDNHDAVLDGVDAPSENAFPGPRGDARQAAAYQAWYEHMPWRLAQAPRGNRMRIHRRLHLGDLADLHLVDTRQFRDDTEVCKPVQPGADVGPSCPQLDAPERTMTGGRQERWLLRGLERSQARWNVLAQTISFAPFDYDPGPAEVVYRMGWDGYTAQRRRITEHLQDAAVSNPVVLTGDWHSTWVNQVTVDPEDPESAPVAPEFMGTSISSDGGYMEAFTTPEAFRANPQVRYAQFDERGYLRVTLDRREMQVDERLVRSVAQPYAPIRTASAWSVEAGHPVPQRRDGGA